MDVQVYPAFQDEAQYGLTPKRTTARYLWIIGNVWKGGVLSGRLLRGRGLLFPGWLEFRLPAIELYLRVFGFEEVALGMGKFSPFWVKCLN